MLSLYYDTYLPSNQFDGYRTLDDHLKHKYLLSVEGNSAAWKRIPWIMASNSVLFKTTEYSYQWFYDGLIPWHNYIPIRPDLQDFRDKIEWAKNNDELV